MKETKLDLVGKRFGRWVAQYVSSSKNDKRSRYHCVCDCGTEREVLTQNLLNGSSKSCGCLLSDLQSAKTPNIIGKRYGRLVVVEQDTYYVSSTGKTKNIRWICMCDCGNKTSVIHGHLMYGRSKSCGCIQREHDWSPSNKSHGMSNSKDYLAWQGMLNRCRNKNHVSFKHYGGRGISVCDRWANSFDDFMRDMGPRPSGLTLERINNNGNYDPSNCKWATHKEQSMNRRKSEKKNASRS